MPVPVEIAFRNCKPDEEVREHILREAGRLFECHPRPSGCSVAIERLASHGMGPPACDVDLRVTIPGQDDVVIRRAHRHHASAERPRVAIAQAFYSARRQIRSLGRAS